MFDNTHVDVIMVERSASVYFVFGCLPEDYSIVLTELVGHREACQRQIDFFFD